MIQDDPKMTKLEQELKSARAEFEEDYNPKPAPSVSSEGANIGYEFLAYVISGGVLGYGLDRYFGTIPLFFMICMVLGFVLGVFRANSRTKKAALAPPKKTVEK